MSDHAIEPEGVDQVEPAEPAWSGPSQEEWEQTQAQLAEAAALVEAVRQAEAAQQGQQDPLSDYDPEFVKAIDQRIDQRLTPYQSFQEQQIQARAEEALRDMFHDVSVRDGEFDADMARRRYEDAIGPMVEKYGQTIRAAEEAVAVAAREQRDYEARIRQQAVEQYQNQLRGISGAPREPAAAGTQAAVQHVIPEGGDEKDLVRAYFPTGR